MLSAFVTVISVVMLIVLVTIMMLLMTLIGVMEEIRNMTRHEIQQAVVKLSPMTKPLTLLESMAVAKAQAVKLRQGDKDHT